MVSPKMYGFYWPTLYIMIDYWHHPVVRPSATLCIVAFRRFRVGVQDQTLLAIGLPACSYMAANFLFVCSATFDVGPFSHKTHGKTRVEENANVSHFDFHACIGLACITYC